MRRASSDCSDALSASGRPAAECSSRTLPCPNAAMRAPPRHQLTPRAMHATQQRLAQAPPAAPAPARSLCCCRRSARPPAATAAASSASIRQLLDAADGQRWGATATPQQRQQVLGLVAELKAAASAAAAAGDSSSSSAPTAGPLDGDWQLVWTTEASVHQLAGGQLLGLAVEDIRQRVCLKQQRVTNTIAFGALGLQLQASGPLRVLSASRIAYSFDQLQLGLAGVQLPLPLLFKGGGWTDAVVLADGVRVMENSRSDTLVLERATS